MAQTSELVLAWHCQTAASVGSGNLNCVSSAIFFGPGDKVPLTVPPNCYIVSLRMKQLPDWMKFQRGNIMTTGAVRMSDGSLIEYPIALVVVLDHDLCSWLTLNHDQVREVLQNMVSKFPGMQPAWAQEAPAGRA